MPSFVLVQGVVRTGQVTAAQLCDLTAAGGPDKKTAVPVSIRLTSDQLILVDDEPRQIIQAWGENGRTSYLVGGSTQRLRNADRRRELARATALLEKLRDCLLHLKDASEDASLVTLGLQELYEWVAKEHERLSAKPTPKQLIGGCDDPE
jgi:hypothetical protein